MHHKRKKSKRNVRDTLATAHRWKGNSADRHPRGDQPESDESRLTPAPKVRRVRKRFCIEAKVRDPKDTIGQWYLKHYADWSPYKRFMSERAARQSLDSHLRNGILSRVLDFRFVTEAA